MAPDMLHHSVLLQEVVDALGPTDGHYYLDATFGNGGYSRALLERADCCVVAIDRDPDAIQRGAAMQEEFAGRFALVEGCFSDMATLIKSLPPKPHGLRNGAPEKLDGAAFDLGVCSTQLDQADRGFSFKQDGPLDMRMEKSGISAEDFINSAAEKDIADVLWRFGEERASRRIARAIIRSREETPIRTTFELARLIRGVLPRPKPGQIDPATRSFQAIRIHINDELAEIDAALPAALASLRAHGRLAVVAFHSLEDRLVKTFMMNEAGKAPRPSRHLPDLPEHPPRLELITRKPITATEREMEINPRSRSARLRVAQRTDAPLWDEVA